MIHLDRGHSSAIAGHTKSNLILADPPHADQHPLLAWSPRPDAAFYHEHQDPFTLTSDTPKPPLSSNAASAPAKPGPPSLPSSNHGPITPADAEEPKLPEPSPSSPTDTRSPVAETSSSLSPPPDAATPSAVADAEANVDKSSGRDVVAGPAEAPPEGGKANTAQEVDRASRASTPLSELSSDDDDEEKTKESGATDVGPSSATPTEKKSIHEANGSSGSAKDGTTLKGRAPAAFKAQSPRGVSAEALPLLPNAAHTATSEVKGLSIPGPLPFSLSSPFSQQDLQTLGSDVTFPNHIPNLAASSPSTKLDPKVVTILELNNQLLSVMMALLDRGMTSDNPMHQQYSAHLQTNLAWLAAAADGKEKGRSSVPLPKMTPPPSVAFLPMERIQRLYAELPTVFAKEIARHEQMNAVPSVIPPPTDLQNSLKRNRPEDIFPDLAHKRRDTGDTKVTTPIPPTIQLSHAGPAQMNAGMLPNAANPLPSLHGTPAPRLGSPAMSPPSIPLGMGPGGNEAHLQAQAARERARQMQMQAMHRQNMQQQHSDGNRQMSPPAVPNQSGMAMQNVAGPSSMGGMQSQQMNIGMMQQLSILQNPNHPLVHYLTQHVPGFTTLPQAQQLQHVQKAQLLLQQRQRSAAQQGQPGGSMQNMNMMNTGMMGNTGMSAGQMGGQSSPTRPMQQVSPGGGMSMGNIGTGGGGMNMNVAGLTPQQQAFLASMNPQQRQLYFMQQQRQLMPNNGMPNQGMMNPQMMAAAQERMLQQQQQQRMAQASMNANAGMHMSGGMDGAGHIPALRSNPSMQGIARNTRTPSDSAPSPAAGMPQRISGHVPDELQRAMILQQAQQRGITPQQLMQQNAGGGMPQMNFQPNISQPMSMGANPYRMSPPNSAGPSGGFGGMQGGMGGTPQPGVGGQHQWQQASVGGNGQFPFVAPSPAGSQHHSDAAMTPRQMSSTPVPNQGMSQNSPQVDQGGLNDFDIFNWA